MARITVEHEVRRPLLALSGRMKPPVENPAWGDEVRRVYEHDLREMWDATIAPHIYEQYHYLLDFYLSLVDDDAPADVLDVGCAQATLALLLAERGHRVTALDIRPEFLEYASSRHTHGDIRFVPGNLFEADLVPKSFDLVFANQIIEHVLDPVQKIARLAEHLKPGGRLVMTTPNGAYVRNSLPTYEAFSQGGGEFVENSADADGHFFAFVSHELARYFEDAGLTVESSGFLETPLVNGHMKFRYLLPLLPQRINRGIDSFILRCPGLKQSLAHQLFVIGRK